MNDPSWKSSVEEGVLSIAQSRCCVIFDKIPNGNLPVKWGRTLPEGDRQQDTCSLLWCLNAWWKGMVHEVIEGSLERQSRVETWLAGSFSEMVSIFSNTQAQYWGSKNMVEMIWGKLALSRFLGSCFEAGLSPTSQLVLTPQCCPEVAVPAMAERGRSLPCRGRCAGCSQGQYIKVQGRSKVLRTAQKNNKFDL